MNSPKWLGEISLNWLSIGIPLFVISLLVWNIRSDNSTRLVIASKVGNIKLCEQLLASGTNPNSVRGTNTPLIVAVKAQHYDLVRVLLEKGAKVEIDGGSGFTPLIWAVRNNDLSMAAMLLKYGANPQRTNVDGKTPYEESLSNSAIRKLLSNE